MNTFWREPIDAQWASGDIATPPSQTAAFFLMTGIDLAAACRGDIRQRARLACRVERLLERERLRGLRRHWSYDLGRHIALKQALLRLNAGGPQTKTAP